MRILIIGSGGREHALAWKVAQSPRVKRVWAAPGNGGTAAIAENVDIAATDLPALLAFARQQQIDLTVVGPEAPLVAGLVDAFAAAGLRAFGPTAAAAQLEGSKAFARRFMVEEGIPTTVAAVFRDHATAKGYLQRQELPVVVKASGLAAGKGVTICKTMAEAEAALQRAMVERVFGAAGDEVLIEDCLQGEEASLLAFSDGQTAVPLLPARDYKRVGDGDRGPNTGGMGGYAPSPHLPPGRVNEVVARVIQPTIDGMRRRGTPYVGLLYAGLMLTEHGPRVLEFNCRFGDPETQVLLPLLASDLVEIMLACLEERLEQVDLHWHPGSTVCLVLASEGYPGAYERGKQIDGVPEVEQRDDVVVFQAGTKRQGGKLYTAGGRVLAVAARAPTLSQARQRAYAAVEGIHFDGAHYRRDIAAQPTAAAGPPAAPQPSAYAAAGVDIQAGNRAVELMTAAVRSTYTPAVLAGIGPFGGLFGMKEAIQARDPVLVASTDGVGTKTMIAAAMGRYDTVGHDIVNHCCNDTLVQGARPLFFLDYIAAGTLNPEHVAAVVGGCAAACRAIGCALIGGETAEMPGVYRPGTFDLVGTMIGWVEREAIIDGREVQPGDVCLGLSSSGLHTNGYSLARHVLAGIGWETVLPELGRPLGEVLLTPHRAYLQEVESLWAAGVTIRAMAHITGGGFPDNLPRVLPAGTGARIDRAAWEVPEIFCLIQEQGVVEEMEMYRVFNMGIGLVIVVGPEMVTQALAAVPEARVIGQITRWNGQGPRVELV
ncbi:MAG: phosphoribosylamine--glycine ligase [Anaerolineae bacterium]|nr:phosphoribosylamine--glycine ligase [Anaerolineae bacterium]